MIVNKDSFNNGWIPLIALLGVSAVAIGAIAAHVVSDPKAVAALEKAALYQLIHAVVMLFTLLLSGGLAMFCRWVMLVGIVLFCGSIEVKYLLDVKQATVVAPFGGVCLMLAWILLGVTGMRQKLRTS